MNATHTPGPWKVEGVFPDPEKGHAFEPRVAIVAPGDPTCRSYSGDIRIADIPDVLSVDCEEMANAVLAAAAPELLIALKAMVASYDGLRTAVTSEVVLSKLAAADAAIAQAEGRQ